MTSRERIKTALDFREPDRPPVDFGGHRSSGIMAMAYAKLRRHLGLPEKPVKVYDMIQQLAVVDEDVLDLFGVDTIELGRGFCLEEKDWKPWTLPDGTGCLIPSYINLEREGEDWFILNPSGRRGGVQRKGMLYFDQIHWPYLEGIPDDLSGLPVAVSDIVWSVPTPPNLALTDTAALERGARRLRESTDRAVIFLFGGNLLEMGQFLCRIDNFLMYMAAEPEKTSRLLDALVTLHLANLEKLLPVVGPYADII
ncbi:MAG: methyltransferase, partial [Spirochaetales bacterium]